MYKISTNNFYIKKYKKYIIRFSMIALLISYQFFPVFMKPIIAPATAIAPGAILGSSAVMISKAKTVADIISFVLNVFNVFKEAKKVIQVPPQETTKTIETIQEIDSIQNNLEKFIAILEDKYQDNLNITIDSLDDVTKRKILEIGNLITNINQQLQEDIKLVSQETQTVIKTASQEIEYLSNELEQSFKEVIIVGGKTTAYIIDRSTYNMILVVSIIFLGIGLLLFIWLLYSKKLPRGKRKNLIFSLMAVYFISFFGLTFFPPLRGQVMAFTGVGLEKRLNKVDNEPSMLAIMPEVITLENTKELEIWGNTLLVDGKPPKVIVGDREIKIKAFSDTKIVLDVAELKIPEGSANLELIYEKKPKLPAIVKVKKPAIPPDLVITNLTISPSNPIRRRNTKATISVKNVGNTEANDFILEWKPTTNDAGKRIKVHSLKPGESKDFSDNFSYNSLGTFDTLVTIDPNQTIAESNEANNSIAQEITVSKVPLKRAIVRVDIDKVNIKNDTDKFSNGEVNLSFDINDKKLNWYQNNIASGKTYNINKVSRVILNESENLRVFINGFDKDGDAEDAMGMVNREFKPSSNWGKGKHHYRSSKGYYEIYYTINVWSID